MCVVTSTDNIIDAVVNKRLEDGKHDIHIIASQNVKIPGHMDLILDKWSIPG